MKPGEKRQIPDEIQAEAAVWLARLRSDEPGISDQADFRAWLAEDALHAEAFEHVNAVWDIAGGLDTPSARPEFRATLSRRVLMLGGTTVAAAAAVGAYRLFRYDSYATRIGEQRRFALQDGSSITLDTDTEIRVKMTEARRQIQLVRGQAYFQVASDLLRPFVVQAGDRQVVALGTAFDVRQEHDGTAVTLLEGRVAVQPAGKPSIREGKLLRPGDRVRFGRSGQPTLDRPDLQLVTAWQSGRAIFDNKPLGEAVLEMSRYSPRRIVVTDKSLEALRISGVYKATDTEGFARSVTMLLPASVRIMPDAIMLSLAANGPGEISS